jgi:hypothetical protein
MSLAVSPDRLQLPESLRRQLLDFRRRVWLIKMIEALCVAAMGIMVAYLLLFAVDRVVDTPTWLRGTLFAAAALGCAAIPLALHRWVWRQRQLEQLALLLARKHPLVGDQLLGIIELARNEFEQARSRQLCEAAIREVAKDAQSRDFRTAVPNPRHRLWVGLLTIPVAIAIALVALFPDAARNAWARLAPWSQASRYTFAALEPLPDHLVVPHGEPFSLTARLTEKSDWQPAVAAATLGSQPKVQAALKSGQYQFDLPAQIESGSLAIKVGDVDRSVKIEPTLRPEMTSIVADVKLPAYLGRAQGQHKDVRGGTISLVMGADVTFTATAGRDLASAKVDGTEMGLAGARFSSPAIRVEGPRTVEFRWRDTLGLEGKEPFTLTVTGREDEPPTIGCEDLPRQKVILDTELLSFKITAGDDFGVRRVGIEWQGAENPGISAAAHGERVLAAGGNDKETLQLGGTFSAKSLGIEPQPIQLRIFAEDYFPGRARVYSAPYTFYVLTAEQHAIWLTEQLSKWHRQSLEVRDREMQLYETNKQLRALASEELDQPENRRKVEAQAAAERSNGRRLSTLVSSGEDLVRQAMRNPEFGVGHLEKWAEMLQILKDISGNRMPSVADLLKQAAQSPTLAANGKPTTPTRMAGQVRASGTGKPSVPAEKQAPAKPAPPRVADVESSQNSPPDPLKPQAPTPSKGGTPPQKLATTILIGKPQNTTPPPPTPAEQKVDEAISKQQDLLAEFDKIAEELNRVLANLEGSTLVKRLKAASRTQYKIGGKVSDQLGATFGVSPTRQTSAPSKVLGEMAELESKGSHDVSVIMDDMQAYFERRGYMRFKTVLDEMRTQDVVGSLRVLGDDLKKENGLSIAQTEFWSDTLDRWAEDLVDPACNGSCPGGKSPDSLPPSIVLEVLQILEGEVNLREETRVAQQAKAATKPEEHKTTGRKLSDTQDKLEDRTSKVTQRIRELPNSAKFFGYEINLLSKVSTVMNEASEILVRPETGSTAIAAETEAIELLLQSKRINPKKGGGGGSTPGGGGTGSTKDSAIALLGGGQNDKEVREDHGIAQSTGDSGPALPEEFRAGLDEYFSRLEKAPASGK